MVGGPGFEPGASRSQTGVMSCPLVSSGVRAVPPVLEMDLLRVLPVTSCIHWVPRMRDTAVTSNFSETDLQSSGVPSPDYYARRAAVDSNHLPPR